MCSSEPRKDRRAEIRERLLPLLVQLPFYTRGKDSSEKAVTSQKSHKWPESKPKSLSIQPQVFIPLPTLRIFLCAYLTTCQHWRILRGDKIGSVYLNTVDYGTTAIEPKTACCLLVWFYPNSLCHPFAYCIWLFFTTNGTVTTGLKTQFIDRLPFAESLMPSIVDALCWSTYCPLELLLVEYRIHIHKPKGKSTKFPPVYWRDRTATSQIKEEFNHEVKNSIFHLGGEINVKICISDRTKEESYQCHHGRWQSSWRNNKHILEGFF